MELATTGSPGLSYYDLGNNNGALSTRTMTAAVNMNTGLGATDTGDIDALVIRGGSADFVNAMLTGSGTSRGIQMECSGTGNHGFYALTVGQVIHTEVIYSPLTGTVNTSGTAVTWVSGTPFDSTLLYGTAQITINGTAYTVSAVNSATSLTLTGSAGTQTAQTFFGWHYIKIYSGWSSPSSPGSLLTTIACAGKGVLPSDVSFGDLNSNSLTTGTYIYFDSGLVSFDALDPL